MYSLSVMQRNTVRIRNYKMLISRDIKIVIQCFSIPVLVAAFVQIKLY